MGTGAELGDNPHKPVRPWYTSHTDYIGNSRFALDGEVRQGNQTAAAHTRPVVLLGSPPQTAHPGFRRGDGLFGIDHLILDAKTAGLPYVKTQTDQPDQGLDRVTFAESW